MQLVLMKTPVNFQLVKQHLDEPLTFRSTVNNIYRDCVTWRDGKDEMARKLIYKLFQWEDSELMIKLRADQRPYFERYYELKLKHVGKINILENLRRQLRGAVKVSVSIAIGGESCKNGNRESSTTEMTIEDTNKCEGSIHLELNQHRWEECQEGYKLEENRPNDIWSGFTATVTITAHIHGSEEEIIAAYEHPVPIGRRILEQGLCSDLTILAMDGVKAAAYKNFVSVASPVLRAQFGGKWEGTSELDMSDISEEGIKAFLRYAYYEDLDKADEHVEIAYELLHIAHKYEMVSLGAMMIARFVALKDEEISVELAYAIYALVRHIEAATELKSRTAGILWWNAEDVENLPDFKELLRENASVAEQIRSEIANSSFMTYCERNTFYRNKKDEKTSDKNSDNGDPVVVSDRKADGSSDTDDWS